MFRSVLVLGHILGLRIEVHVSWLIIFTLLLVTMSSGLQTQFPDWSWPVSITTAAVTALMFFASILAHEMGHSLVAVRRGVPVKGITLFIFGGISQMTSESKTPNDEFWIAIAGPLVSLLLVFVFGALSYLTVGWYEPVPVVFNWLALVNLVVLVFNLIPGFPLDGGRVFRALVWKFSGDARKSIRAGVMGGRIVAYTLFALGLYIMLVTGSLLSGLWIILIAWFLLHMAESQGRMYGLEEYLAGLQASELAETRVPTVSPDTRVADWIESQVLHTGQRAGIVGDAQKAEGLVTMSDARRLPRSQWQTTRVADVMTPIDRVVSVRPDANAGDVLKLMNEHNLNQIPIIEGDRVNSWIDRQRLLRTVELHGEVSQRG